MTQEQTPHVRLSLEGGGFAGLIVLLVCVLFAQGCGQFGGNATVNTPDGRYRVTKVDTPENFPPGCGSNCFRPISGYRTVAVTFERQTGPSAKAFFDDGCRGEKIYLATPDGTKGVCGVIQSMSSNDKETIVIAFAAPKGKKGFQLYLPDNDPVRTGQ